MFIRIGAVLAGLFIHQAFAQTTTQTTTSTTPTTINLQTQSRNPDFSSFPFTRPVSVGSALPSTCQVGQLYFNSAAQAGSNLYACTTSNTWTLESAPAAQATPGVTMSSQLGDFATTLSNGTLTIGANCSGTTPCNVRIGSAVYRFTNPATVTASGSTTGIIWGYIDAAGNLSVGGNPTLTCSGCTYVPGITAFPNGSIPLFSWTLTYGTFDVGGGTDFRAFLSRKNLQSGAGVLLTESAGTSIVAIDPSLVSLRVLTPPTSSSAACTVGQFSFDSNYYYLCTGANTWKRIALTSF